MPQRTRIKTKGMLKSSGTGQTSPLGVYKYAVVYPKTEVLAQFVDSKAFFLSPLKRLRLFKKSIDFLNSPLFFILKFSSALLDQSEYAYAHYRRSRKLTRGIHGIYRMKLDIIIPVYHFFYYSVIIIYYNNGIRAAVNR